MSTTSSPVQNGAPNAPKIDFTFSTIRFDVDPKQTTAQRVQNFFSERKNYAKGIAEGLFFYGVAGFSLAEAAKATAISSLMDLASHSFVPEKNSVNKSFLTSIFAGMAVSNNWVPLALHSFVRI